MISIGPWWCIINDFKGFEPSHQFHVTFLFSVQQGHLKLPWVQGVAERGREGERE